MNVMFGLQLRKELEDMIICPEMLQKQAKSTRSQRISMDSLPSNEDDYVEDLNSILHRDNVRQQVS